MKAQDFWAGDKLGYEDVGRSFTNLVKSIGTEKVISIEAGFGRGKTFFRKAWSQQLRSEGEVVIEVDVQQSDHSGDPVVTLLGALVNALPAEDKGKGKKAFESARKIGVIGARAVTRAVLKSGADEVLDAISESAIYHLEDFDALDGVIKGVGEEMSKAAGQLIAAQMASEKVRQKELPEQLDALRAALTGGSANERVVVIIDELDRCHPEYAIAFLEATKLIFNRAGFVFCLMINANYLENLARHRFGVANEDEKYLDKFVDIRLKLQPSKEVIKTAVYDLACTLPLDIPFGKGREFSVATAADLASELAVACGFSMRKIERILFKVEVALRCYSDRPLDAPLLVFFAFQDEAPDVVKDKFLRRSLLTPGLGERTLASDERRTNSLPYPGEIDSKRNNSINELAPELLKLPRDRYRLPDDKDYKPWALAYKFLAPFYIPEHRDILDSVADVLVSEE